MGKLRKRVVAFSVAYVIVAAVGLYLAHETFFAELAPRDVSYSEMLRELRAGRITKVELREHEILAELRPRASARPGSPEPQPIVAQRLPHIDETALLLEMERRGVVFSGRVDVAPWWETALLGWLLPIGLIVLIYALIYLKVRKSTGPMMLGGRENVKIYDANEDEKVTFEDVAGVDEALGELREIVDYLKKPEKYLNIGARAPKGVLLVGPPGTGKTLLAKAVAGEAGVHFFSVSAPAFVEMFVGVGAARMRKLFEQAREKAPCIVFIDELDAIGKARGGGSAHGGHDEREQTLNQLLVEMDGFDSSGGVILMAATNRPETLDAALLRAGRFDRTVVVDRPNRGERDAILRVHAKKARIADDVDLKVIAQRTPGMVGADLANLVNEAALAAARRASDVVSAADFEEAVDRLQLGLKKQKRVMSEDERRRVAFHEGGHTLVALSVEHADPVHRVSIIPRSIGALGVTLQLPDEERYMMTRVELLDRICVMLGGRAAEELVYGELSTGAENDLERASETARRMVTRFGMSDKLGPLSFGRQGARFMETHEVETRTFSEDTARAIDAEVRLLIETQYQRAADILRKRRMVLHRIADELLERETLEREELATIMRESRELPRPSRPSHDAN